MALTTVTNQRVRNGNDSLVIPINAYDSTIPSANHVMQIVSRQQQPYQDAALPLPLRQCHAVHVSGTPRSMPITARNHQHPTLKNPRYFPLMPGSAAVLFN